MTCNNDIGDVISVIEDRAAHDVVEVAMVLVNHDAIRNTSVHSELQRQYERCALARSSDERDIAAEGELATFLAALANRFRRLICFS
jgi:hypothetical protein